MSADSDDEVDGRCPFCDSSIECKNLLLAVDKTLRSAEGGVLIEVFNKRWFTLIEAGGDDFEERDAFDTLLEEVGFLAGASTSSYSEGGPGMSSACASYYSSKAKVALKQVEDL